MFILYKIICFLYVIQFVNCYRILVIFPYNGESHFTPFQSMFKNLAEKGHQLTVISYFPQRNPTKNYRDIILQEKNILQKFNISINDFVNFKPYDIFYKKTIIFKLIENRAKISCIALLENKEVHAIKKGEYDLVLLEQFNSDCAMGIVNELEVPFIGLSTHFLAPFFYSRIGLWNNPSYFSLSILFNKRDSSLTDCVLQLFTYIYYNVLYYYNIQRPEYELLKKYYGEDLPDLETISNKMSLVICISHSYLHGSYLYPLNMIEVGGIHLHDRTTDILDRELQEMLDSSTEGFIYFSMGSMLPSEWPEEIFKELKSAFAELPYKIIWKWNNVTMDGVSENVMYSKWFPQYEVLSHKNAKGFITHGGMSSVIEAVHAGIPMIVFPALGGQRYNGDAIVDSGVGVMILLDNITRESIQWGVKEIMSQKMQERAKVLSELWKDRPLSAMETAIYWIEHVARHGGSHLRSKGANLHWTRYYLIDILAFIVSVVILMLFIMYKLIGCLYYLLIKNKLKKD